MKVLFIGGTGIISSACSNLAVKMGIDLYHLNRGLSHRKINGVNNIKGDIRKPAEVKKILADYEFDAVVDWIAFVPEHVENDIDIFKDKTKQYIFISSASAYKKPVNKLPITEETPLDNPFWQYSRDKAACEKILFDEYKNSGFPATVVRPSHTYDKTLLPTDWGYTVIDRMKKGKKVIIHGDGTSLWVMTNHRDFAKGFNGLLGNGNAVGEAFHITSDELLPWNRIYELMAKELKLELNFIHIPSDIIARYDKDMGPNLLGDKAHSVIFDNTKIKNLVPEFKAEIKFEEGVKEIINWYENNPEFQIVYENLNKMMDKMAADYS